jgi:hypothetical protein
MPRLDPAQVSAFGKKSGFESSADPTNDQLPGLSSASTLST